MHHGGNCHVFGSTNTWLDRYIDGRMGDLLGRWLDDWLYLWIGECLQGQAGAWLHRRQIKERGEMINVVSFGTHQLLIPIRVQSFWWYQCRHFAAERSSVLVKRRPIEQTINQCTIYYVRLQHPQNFNRSWSEELEGLYSASRVNAKTLYECVSQQWRGFPRTRDHTRPKRHH